MSGELNHFVVALMRFSNAREAGGGRRGRDCEFGWLEVGWLAVCRCQIAKSFQMSIIKWVEAYEHFHPLAMCINYTPNKAKALIGSKIQKPTLITPKFKCKSDEVVK